MLYSGYRILPLLGCMSSLLHGPRQVLHEIIGIDDRLHLRVLSVLLLGYAIQCQTISELQLVRIVPSFFRKNLLFNSCYI